MEAKAQQFLQQYLRSLCQTQRLKYTSFSADYFCADKNNADLCAQLILKGKKVATCSLSQWYESTNESMPTVGHLMVVLDWQQTPVCIIEIDSVEKCAFNNVTSEFAYCEGEGDRSLTWWKEAHWNFFSDECKQLGIKATEDMPLILERFHLVYPTSDTQNI